MGAYGLWDRLLDGDGAGDEAWGGYIDAPRPRPTKLAVLDLLLGGGIYPGLNVLMAAPGAGKTALAIQLLATNALAGGESLMFSLEMPVMQVRMRVASWLSVNDARLSPVPWSGTYQLADRSWARVPWDRVREDPDLAGDVEYLGYDTICGTPWDLPLEEVARRVRGNETARNSVERILRASGDQTIAAVDEARRRVLLSSMAVTSDYRDVSAICRAIGQVTSELGRPPLVAVDYLQIVSPPDEASGQGETEATKATSDELARCARDAGAVVLCVSAKRKGAGPEMDAARGSSAITYNAQTVIHLDDDPQRAAVRGWKPVVLDVSKNRSGSQGKVPLWFNGRYNAFSDAEDPPASDGEPPFAAA